MTSSGEMAGRGAPQARRWRWSLLFVIWALVGLMFVAPTYLQFVTDGASIPWSRLFSELAGWYLWAVLFPFILWGARRFRFERRVWPSQLLIHLAIGSAVSAVYALLETFKSYLIIAIATGDFTPHILFMGPGYLFGGFSFYFLIYCAMVAVIHAYDYYLKYQERDLVTSRLEAQLAQTQLQVLRMQLHPHFLFNTLHAISALLYKDVEGADRMITLLSDFLRLSLENAGKQEVPLKRELEFLDRYVEIEKVRFGERLSVELDVDSELLDVKVPNLILQPLVENAIRHGIARRAGSGHVEVRARMQYPKRVEIEVEDDGPGVRDLEQPLRLGVGLSNTKARLEQIYGKAQRFEIGNGKNGGFLVSLSIPYRPDYWLSSENERRRTSPREPSATDTPPSLVC